MIYFFSDVHGDKHFKGLKEYLSMASETDLLIILGDIELNFAKTEENAFFTEFFLSIKKNIAFIDGNHENHPYLNSFPEETWNGGCVNRLSDNIIRLKRGNVYDIEGKSFFVMGGCKSSPKWKEMGLWYEGEEPSEEELSLAYENLKNHKNKVDYVLTHNYMRYKPWDEPVPPMSLIGISDYIDSSVDFGHWYSGHWHENKALDEKHTLVYDELTCI